MCLCIGRLYFYNEMEYRIHYRIHETYRNESWYPPIRDHLNIRYQAIESRLSQTFYFVTPDASNRATHSFTFSSILRDIGSVFDSVVRELIVQSGQNYQRNIEGYIQYLEDMDPSLEKRTILFTPNVKRIVPLQKNPETGIPDWWHAYNDVKYSETRDYSAGNLENTITALASLAILRSSVSGQINTSLFKNIGIIYPDDDPGVSRERLLFPLKEEKSLRNRKT